MTLLAVNGQATGGPVRKQPLQLKDKDKSWTVRSPVGGGTLLDLWASEVERRASVPVSVKSFSAIWGLTVQ